VRVLDEIFPLNISLQTLDGVLTHNGELELEEYHPEPIESFEKFDEIIENCYQDKLYANKLIPSTLEGCVVRISDIIAYLGKDRQDATRARLVDESEFINEDIGSLNAEIINKLVVNIIENSYGKPYIKLDTKHFRALKKSKKDNYAMIYNNAAALSKLDTTVKPMMSNIYEQLLDDVKNENKKSPIYTQHINQINGIHYKRKTPYEMTEPNQLVVDYIASMTDDYLVELHHYLFPKSDLTVEYKGYFDEEEDKYV
jgi:dGTPase